MRATIEAAGAAPGERLGIATQRSTVLFWNRDTGRPLTPAYSWQDRRGAALCDRLRREFHSTRTPECGELDRWVHERTGLRWSPHYSASKLAWALSHVRGLRAQVARGRALWGTLGAFLVWHMSGGSAYAIDHANAQRTLLFDLASLKWDPDLVHLFGLDALLDSPVTPNLVPTVASPPVPLESGGRRLRLGAITGDQQAATLGLGCRRPGDVAINYGTGAFVLELTGSRLENVPGLLTTLVASWRGVRSLEEGGDTPRAAAIYATEGTVNAAGTAIEWAQRRLGLRIAVEDLDAFLKAGRAGRRVHFLPAVTGLGAPHWEASARPRYAGDLRGATPGDLLRAVVESIALRCAEILRAVFDATGDRMTERPIVVAGGLTRCRTLLQAQADLLQRPLLLRESLDATALGAALLARPAPAGRIPGIVASAGRLIRPRLSRDEAEARFTAWSEAVYGASSEGPRAPPVKTGRRR
jgi:glycerol kinase